MTVRSSTDLPAPDAPTTPRISPRLTSSERWSSTRWGPNPTTRSRILIITWSAGASIRRSHSDRGEEHGEQAVEDDDEEDRFHHRDRRLGAERFGTAFYGEALAAGDDADRERHERRLDHADLEMRHRNRVAQPGDEHGRAHPAIEPGHEAAAIERGHGAEEGQDRQ